MDIVFFIFILFGTSSTIKNNPTDIKPKYIGIRKIQILENGGKVRVNIIAMSGQIIVGAIKGIL